MPTDIIIEHSSFGEAFVTAAIIVPEKDKDLIRYLGRNLVETCKTKSLAVELKKYSKPLIEDEMWQELSDLSMTAIKTYPGSVKLSVLARSIKIDFEEVSQSFFEDHELSGLVNLSLIINAIELIQLGKAILGAPRELG